MILSQRPNFIAHYSWPVTKKIDPDLFCFTVTLFYAFNELLPNNHFCKNIKKYFSSVYIEVRFKMLLG